MFQNMAEMSEPQATDFMSRMHGMGAMEIGMDNRYLEADWSCPRLMSTRGGMECSGATCGSTDIAFSHSHP